MKTITKQYTLDYIQSFEGDGGGGMCSRHDVSAKKWRLDVRLTDNGYFQADWFLAIFFHDDGRFDKFSLDYIEAYADFHYGFEDEAEIRKILYMDGDEDLYFHEIAIRYCEENGGDSFYKLIEKYITSRFHYIDSDLYDDE